MATLAAPPVREKGKDSGQGGSSGGNGDWGGGAEFFPEQRYYTGMWLGLAAIAMFFVAFTSAYIVRSGLGDDWRPISLPWLLWPNTLVLLLSSWTLEKARRCRHETVAFARWWRITMVLGGLFLLGQLAVWVELREAGLYLSTNPAASFFYVLTASHGLHLLGGLVALAWVWRRLLRGRLAIRQSTALGVSALYWHSMDGLWIYILLLLLLWR